MYALLKYSDNTEEKYFLPFCADSTQWQYVSQPIVPKHPEKTVATITVYCRYDNNANKVYFDNLSLVREVAQAYTYNEDGKLESVLATQSPEEDLSLIHIYRRPW